MCGYGAFCLSSRSWAPGLFPLGAVRINVAVTTIGYEFFCAHVFSVLSGIYAGEELLGPVTRRTLSSRM